MGDKQAQTGSRIFNFQSPGRVFAKFWDSGIFGDGISLKFLSWDFAKKTWCLLQKERNLDEKEKLLCFDDRHT